MSETTKNFLQKLSKKEICSLILIIIGLMIFGIGLTANFYLNINSSSESPQLQDSANTISLNTDNKTYNNQTNNQDVNYSSEAQEEILIDIGGAVVSPGLKNITYSANTQPRLYMAIDAAGGWEKDVHQIYLNQELNLARIIKDGEKIYIPFEFEDINVKSNLENMSNSISNSSSSDIVQISLNQSSLQELQELKGVGEAIANKIVQNRPFESIEMAVIQKVISQRIWDDNAEILSL